MGNFCADNAIKQRAHRNSRDVRQVTKFFQGNSLLKIEIETWLGQIMPDLRSDLNISKQQCYIDKGGHLVFSEKLKQVAFHERKQQNRQNEKDSNETQDSVQKNSSSQLALNIQKSPQGYKLTYITNFIYELIIQPRQIQEGDILLLGGTEYKFLKFIKDNSYGKKKLKTITHFDDVKKINVKTREYMNSFSKIPQEQQTPQCRICMGQQLSSQNPLICPCDCIGSVKYFHLNCWTEWAFTSQTSSENIYTGNVKKQKCELCKKSLLSCQYYRETVAAVLSSVHKIKSPFIVLEGLKPLPNYPYYRKVELNYVILSFADKKKYTIGRGKNSDIQLIIDNSISRKNSVVCMKNEKIYFGDYQSKHGTYIKTQNPVFVTDNVPKSFLYKNNLISVKIE